MNTGTRTLPAAVRYRQLSFERAARHYDAVSDVQRRMALDLTTLLPEDAAPPRHVLELGCGTGHLSELLISRFSRARFLITDLSGAMLGWSRSRLSARSVGRMHWLQLDAGEAHWGLRSRFDLVASSAMVQWIDDLPGHLASVAERLRPGAQYLVSGFRRDNLPELARALQRVDVAPRIGHSQADLERGCSAVGLRLVVFREDSIRQEYGGAREFFDTLRTMGASRYPAGKPLAPSALRELMRDYAQQNPAPAGVSATWRPWYALLKRRG